MSTRNPYSSPETAGSGQSGELIRKPQLSGFAITAAAILNLIFLGAPGYFVVGQYAKGCVMGLASLVLWVLGLGFIPTFVAVYDVIYLGQRLRRGEGIEAWEFFENRTAPEPVPVTERDPALIYKEHPSLIVAILGNVFFLGGAGYFATGQNAKAIAAMFCTLMLMFLGIGLIVPLFTAADVTASVLRQRRGEGLGKWQFF